MSNTKTVILQALRNEDRGNYKIVQGGRFRFNEEGKANIPVGVAKTLIESSPFYELAAGSEWPEGVEVVAAPPLSPEKRMQLNNPHVHGNAGPIAVNKEKVGDMEVTVSGNSWDVPQSVKSKGAAKLASADSARIPENTPVPNAPDAKETEDVIREEFSQMSTADLKSILKESGSQLPPNAPKKLLVNLATERAVQLRNVTQSK